ncbi:MAG: hypothetical protein HY363_01125 [Candidatus Aenigmarchaeota archaeon]|nr:hypothetical protein [Candidatus Aenigmarchaeota archaeon]
MPKLSFRIPSKTYTVNSGENHKQVFWVSLVGTTAIIAIVLVVLMLNKTMTGAVTDALPNICGPNALIADNPWYIDQLEKLQYRCLASQKAPIYCCYKK